MKVDTRTRLFIAAIFTLLALVYQDVVALGIILCINLAVLILFRVPLKMNRGLKSLLLVYIVLIIIQSFFVSGGTPLLQVGSFNILTTKGLLIGLSVLLRFLIFVAAGLFLITGNTAELLAALVKMKIPYEIVFMVQLGIRFVPVFSGEIQNTLNAVQLRGVDMRKIYKRKVLGVYINIFSPIVYSVWQKAEKMSMLLELRAFRKYEKRTFYRDVSLNPIDYITMTVSLLMTVGLVFLLGKIT
jgi:energy-coupling factor transport system permease protein